MTKRMLIDATHSEETRVAVVGNNKLEDFDYETTIRKQLKGNIYLVKVTRVEPSLQAAFVDYGGNRHGFLPFPEIHPDYYRIPVEDRQVLLEEEQRIAKERAAEAEAKGDAEAEEKERNAKKKKSSKKKTDKDDSDITSEDEDDDDDVKAIEDVGGEDEMEDNSVHPAQLKRNIKRRYKIQEVIKRGQVMLIQINKEERGNKGAAVSSYISLPGRYCVLMPNSSRGGGVSRKVSNIKDRKRLKKILSDIGVPEGMSVILRTAGVARTKVEIKRDLDYLLRLWNDTRELTLQSIAPAMVHEEGNLIKRAIRDLYKKEIEEILIAGEDGYNTAKKFMKMLIPSHVRRIKLDKDEAPLFGRFQVERQIDETYSPNVRLRSGGYLVINPTEALISIDVNSGKATKGRHIEETAVKTNLEAAEEIARQLRLRDLGGLVVIDFIDMEENRNNRVVERKMREAMQGDRARIQISRISAFGLLELSRQRLRPSLVESNFMVCPHCNGNGVVRTIESAAVMVLRHVEEALLKGDERDLHVKVSKDVALYLVNQKRHKLQDLESHYKAKVTIEIDISASNQDVLLESVNSSGGRVKLYSSADNLDLDKSDVSAHKDGGRNPRRKNNNRNQRRRNNRRRNKGDSGEGAQFEKQDGQKNSVQSLELVESDKKTSVEVVKQADDKPVKDEAKIVEEKEAKEQNKVPVKRGRKPVVKKKTGETVAKRKTVAKKTPARKTKKEAVVDTKPKIVEKTVVSMERVVEKVPEKNTVPKEEPKDKKKGWWQKLKD